MARTVRAPVSGARRATTNTSRGFVGEPITPDTRTADTRRMAAGEPGLPRAFTWRGRKVAVADVLKSWKGAGPCRHGSGETYVRKHWYEVRTASGERMTIYFDRHPATRRRSAARWWLFSVEDEA